MFYTYNYKSRNWLGSEQDIYQPLFTPFSIEKKKAWCSLHKKWEACGKTCNGQLYFECGNPVPSQFASVNKWTISKVETRNETSRDMIKLRVDLVFTAVSEDGRKRYHYAYKTWAFYMRTGFTVPYESEEFLENYPVSLPDSITTEIQNSLAAYAKKLYGTGYANSSYKNGIPALTDYVTCPACPQAADLQNLLGKKFNQVVNRSSSNPYQDICNYIHIKPFKRMRRIFDKNPLALPVYSVLKTWGFKDVNIMTRFLEDRDLCQTYFKYIKYDTNKKRVEIKDDNHCSDLFYFLNDYAKDLLGTVTRWTTESFQVQDEKTTMTHLIKAMKDGYHNFVDAAQMYYSRGAALPETLKKRVVKECFTTEIHDTLVAALPNTYGNHKTENEKIPYLETDKILEATIKDTNYNAYSFILPKDTNELFDLGQKMHNCVGQCYRGSAVARRDIIVGVQLKEKFIACIQLKVKSWTIVQAKGVCNCRLRDEYKEIIKKWAFERGINIRTSDI